MASIATATQQAQKKTALPWPTQPYAGAAPITTPGLAPAPPPTSAPTTVGAALQNTTTTVDQAKANLAKNQPFLDTYLKPNSSGTTDFRQALTNTKASSTADAYDNAVSAARNRSAAMGFSDNAQPVTFGAETGLANERAKAIADIPNKVNLEAQPVEFQAAGLQANQTGMLNALANTQQNETNTLAEAERQKAALDAQAKIQSDAQKAALAGSLASTGVGIGGSILQNALKKTGPAVAAGAAVPGAATAASGAFTAASAPAGFVGPVLPGAAAVGGAAPATGVTGALGLGGGSGVLGLGAATIPVIGAAVLGVTALLKSQAHWEANTFVQQVQNPFGQHLGEVVNGFDQALASGQLDKASASAALTQTSQMIEEFKKAMNAFSQKGSDANQVAHNAARTMAENFGPNFEAILGKMQQEIAGLPG